MVNAYRLRPFENGRFLLVENDRLYMDGVDLFDLAERYGTPLFVYSETRLVANTRTLQTTFSRQHPRTSVCFASKACANLSVLAIVKAQGVDLEVNSGGELHKAKRVGFSADRIVFNGVAKTEAEIELALDPPIKAINVDSIFELQRIVEIAERLGVRANIALRGVPGVEGGSTAGIETGSTRSKFGMTEGEITQCLTLAEEKPAALAVIGLHAHIGSQMTNLGLYADAARYVARLGAMIRERFSADFAHVNIGGGFPINYVKYHDQSSAVSYFRSQISADDIAATVVPILTASLGEDIEILTEPGRALSGDTALCLTRVEGIKKRDDIVWLYLDAGYSTVPESGFGWYFHMVRANGAGEETTAHFRVVGPLCDSINVYFDMEGESKLAALIEAEPTLTAHEALLRENLVRVPPYRELPASTGPGDIIAILDTGAYQFELTNHYCGRPRPGAVMIGEDGKARIIFRRETFDDLATAE